MIATKKVTVLGLGNVLLTDDGFGVHVLRRLEDEYAFSTEVQLLDGGTLGLTLSFFLAETERLLIIDAIDSPDSPGTLAKFAGEALNRRLIQKVSAHEVGLRDILQAASLGNSSPEVVLIGCVGASYDAGLDLSATVAGTVEPCIEMILEQLALWGITYRKV